MQGHSIVRTGCMAALKPSMLSLLLWATLGLGCASPAMRSVGPAFETGHRTRTTLRQGVQDELGADAAEAMPDRSTARPQPPDPGAAALVASIRKRLGARPGDHRVGLWRLRNQSHGSSTEFHAFLERLAELLNRAARETDLHFTADPGDSVDYQMLGASYLTTLEGFDVWELYLSLTATHEQWTLWQGDGPVHVLRQPRPAQRQIFLTRSGEH